MSHMLTWRKSIWSTRNSKDTDMSEEERASLPGARNVLHPDLVAVTLLYTFVKIHQAVCLRFVHSAECKLCTSIKGEEKGSYL